MNLNKDASPPQIKEKYFEHKLALNEFMKPVVDTDVRAIIDKIIMLIMMKPGTYPTRPYMGVGLVENYRYTFMDNLNRLKEEVESQKNTYLPEFSAVQVDFDTLNGVNKELYIYITIYNSMYALMLNTETKTLTWLKNT